MYDAIVIGLGGMGAAALSALAHRGRRVLGVEQFAVGHDRGSSHGHTRVIRTAYYEHPAYVPLCRQSFAAWRELEWRTNRKLLVDCPCLSIGLPDGELIAGVQRAAQEHQLQVESFSAKELTQHFPQFQFDDPYVGVLECEAGFLYVDACVHALMDDAVSHGAEVRQNSAVLGWQADVAGVRVRISDGEIAARSLIMTAGPWAGHLLNTFGAKLSVMRQVVFWFETGESKAFEVPRFPVFMADLPNGCYYGIPATDGHGVKIARHYGAPELHSLNEIQRMVDDRDALPIREFVQRHIPAGDRPVESSSVCIYTLTPDRHFVIDRHPQHANVAVACGFSGHGFKFAPVVGEMLADLVGGQFDRGPELFRITRFV